MICALINGMSFMDKFILSIILLVSFNSYSQAIETINNHNNLIECVEVSTNTDDLNLDYCAEKYQIYDQNDCIEHINIYVSDSKKANQYCREFAIRYDMELFMKDRPTEFFDLFTREEGSITRSFGCHVNYDNNGDAELNTTLLIYEDESEEPTKIEQIATKAIVHIDENLGYSEVNYGSTIFPIAEQRFFTNELKFDESNEKIAGFVNDEIESQYKGGTDRGPFGGGWVIYEKENSLVILAGQYDILIKDNCKWSEIPEDL
tara:strand:+ start:37 stop:822 length:786 start_codon:yes stop_codon:yes gene_type:complete